MNAEYKSVCRISDAFRREKRPRSPGAPFAGIKFGEAGFCCCLAAVGPKSTTYKSARPGTMMVRRGGRRPFMASRLLSLKFRAGTASVCRKESLIFGASSLCRDFWIRPKTDLDGISFQLCIFRLQLCKNLIHDGVAAFPTLAHIGDGARKARNLGVGRLIWRPGEPYLGLGAFVRERHGC